jgi:hypothetical protein
MYRWKDGTTAEQIAAIEAGLRELPGKIDAIREYRFGRDAGIGVPANMAFAIVATFDDAAGWRAYNDAPAHAALRDELILPAVDDRRVIQFES